MSLLEKAELARKKAEEKERKRQEAAEKRKQNENKPPKDSKADSNIDARLKAIEDKLTESNVFIVDKIINSNLKKVLKAYIKQYWNKSRDNADIGILLAEHFKVTFDKSDEMPNEKL